MDIMKRIGYGLIFLFSGIGFTVEAQFDLPPIDPPCAPHCIVDPPDLGNDDYAIEGIVYGEQSPAGFALGEKAEFHITYTAKEPIRIYFSLLGETGCRGINYSEDNHNRYLPAASSSVVTKKRGCGSFSQIDSIAIIFYDSSGQNKLQQNIMYNAIWSDNQINDIDIHLLPFDEEIVINSHQTMQVGDTIQTKFDYLTHHRGKVIFDILPLVRAGDDPEEWKVAKHLEVPIQEAYNTPSGFASTNFVIQEPTIIESFRIQMKTADTKEVLSDTTYSYYSFKVEGNTVRAAFKAHEFVITHVIHALNAGDTVADFGHVADFYGINRLFVSFDLL